MALSKIEKMHLGAGIVGLLLWLGGAAAVITFWVLVFKALFKYLGS